MNRRIKKKIQKRYGARHWCNVGYREGLYLLSLHYHKEFNNQPVTKLPSYNKMVYPLTTKQGFDIPCITVSPNGKKLESLKILKNAYPVSMDTTGVKKSEIDAVRGNNINFHCFDTTEFDSNDSEAVTNILKLWSNMVKSE